MLFFLENLKKNFFCQIGVCLADEYVRLPADYHPQRTLFVSNINDNLKVLRVPGFGKCPLDLVECFVLRNERPDQRIISLVVCLVHLLEEVFRLGDVTASR